MKKFQQYGITAEVRDDGDLFIRAADVTVGIAEAAEFVGHLLAGYAGVLSGDEADAFVADFERVGKADLAEADEFNDEAYKTGTAPVIENTTVPSSTPEVEVHKVEVPTEVGAPIRRGPGRPRKVRTDV